MLKFEKLEPSEHRRRVEERKKNSLLWQWIHAMGSLPCAMLVLGIIAVAVAAATFSESGFSQKIARLYIYDAPWFLAWLGLLCVNLFCVTLTRWPWQRKHLGFVVTHYGIIILLVGAVVGKTSGFEASVTLNQGEPKNRLVINQSVLGIESPKDGSLYYLPFDPEITRPHPDKPLVEPLPDTQLRLEIVQAAKSLVPEEILEPSQEPDAGLGVRLTLSSTMSPRPIELALALKNDGKPAVFDFFGRGTVDLVDRLPTLGGTKKIVRETRVLFADRPEMTVAHGAEQRLFPWSMALLSHPSETASFELSIATGEDTPATTLHLPTQTGQTVPLPSGATLKVESFWNDFTMQGGAPTNASPELRNPACIVTISGDHDTLFLSGRTLYLAPAPQGKLNYLTVSGGKVVSTGTATPGTPFDTGWTSWSAEISDLHPSARVVSRARESQNPLEGGTPGLLLKLLAPDGSRGPEKWLLSGMEQTLTHPTGMVRMGFGLKTTPLPFTVELLQFEVPRDPGTDNPADFRSTVRFSDPATGKTHEALIRMNQPAIYPPESWRHFTGWTYKFSQAGWDPANLRQTTLQVLYDPGWLLKWIGSLLMCLGIATMFYFQRRSA